MAVLKKIFNIFTTLLVIAVLLLAVALVGVRLVGLRPFTVLSGSMEPTYHTGSVIYVKSVDYRELKVGDPITFMLSEDMVATHRIVEIVPDEEDPTVLRYRTKGDANESEDGGLVHYKNVIGKPVFSIPKIGYFVNYIQKPPGTYVAIAGGAFAVLLLFLPELIKALTEDEEKEKAKPKAEKAGQKKPKPEPEPEKPRRERVRPEPEPEKIPENKKCSAENDNIRAYESVIPVTEPVYDGLKEERADKTSSAEYFDTDTYFGAIPAEELPEAEDRPLTRAELRRQAEEAEKAARRTRGSEKRATSRSAEPTGASRGLPQKKKGRHEL